MSIYQNGQLVSKLKGYGIWQVSKTETLHKRQGSEGPMTKWVKMVLSSGPCLWSKLGFELCWTVQLKNLWVQPKNMQHP